MRRLRARSIRQSPTVSGGREETPHNNSTGGPGREPGLAATPVAVSLCFVTYSQSELSGFRLKVARQGHPLPDPDKLLTALRQATMLSRATPGRVGRLVELAGAADVLAVGDLHGHIGNFQQLLKLADLGHHPKRHLVMQELIHGPFRYGDGSDKSHQAVDLWAALKCQFPDRVHYLPGNHEMA